MYRNLPKEQQTAYQRWEIGSLEEELAEKRVHRKTPAETEFSRVETIQVGSLEEVLGPNRARKKLPDEEDFGKVVPLEHVDAASSFSESGTVEDVDIESLSFDSPVSEATFEDVQTMIVDVRQEAEEEGYRSGLAEGLLRGEEEGRVRGYEEGLAKGLEEGRAKGEAEGFERAYREGALQAEDYVTTLKTLSEKFASETARVNEEMTGDILALSLDLAKAMLKTALKVKPELIVPMVADAVRYLPSVQQPAMLYLHPEDAAIVRQALGDELKSAGWRIVEEAPERGTCRIDTPSNQIDSSLGTRWERLAANLGFNSNWME